MLNEKTIEVLPLFPSPLFTRVYTEGDLGNTIKFLDSCNNNSFLCELRV
jgi:hypothetical protein